MSYEVAVPHRVEIEELEAIYRKRFPDFLRIALAITRDEGVARDAVQETFAKALRGRGSFRAEGPLEAWIWGILVNVARSMRTTPLEALDVADPAAPSVETTSNGSSSDFRQWVAALPERQRLAVFLRYWADLDYRSIAAALGVEVGTISATLNAAHAALRRSLKEVSP